MGKAGVLAAGLAAALLSGCATTRLEPPQLDVMDVKLLGGSLAQQDLRVRMRVRNPNARELPVRGITYEVHLDGKSFAQGQTASGFTVPANGEAQFDVDLTANLAGALMRVLGGAGKTEPEYRIFGKVQLARGLMRSIPFEHRGRLDLTQAGSIRL